MSKIITRLFKRLTNDRTKVTSASRDSSTVLIH